MIDESGLHDSLVEAKAGCTTRLVERHKELFDGLVNFIHHLYPSLDEPSCESAAQLAIVKIPPAAQNYRGKTNKQARNYIFTIAKHCAFDLIRNEKKFADIEAYYLINDDRAQKVEDAVVEAEIFTKICDALTSQENKVLDLLLKGYIAVDIAKILTVSKPRVSQLRKNIIEKARKSFGISN
jgi:RNA polymerase sigma factor (sigma-70 family)